MVKFLAGDCVKGHRDFSSGNFEQAVSDLGRKKLNTFFPGHILPGIIGRPCRTGRDMPGGIGEIGIG